MPKKKKKKKKLLQLPVNLQNKESVGILPKNFEMGEKLPKYGMYI
jgi:hypothetical protein